MNKTIGAVLPPDLFKEFMCRVKLLGFPGGKTGLMKDSLRLYFEQNPLTPEQRQILESFELTSADNVDAWSIKK